MKPKNYYKEFDDSLNALWDRVAGRILALMRSQRGFTLDANFQTHSQCHWRHISLTTFVARFVDWVSCTEEKNLESPAFQCTLGHDVPCTCTKSVLIFPLFVICKANRSLNKPRMIKPKNILGFRNFLFPTKSTRDRFLFL